MNDTPYCPTVAIGASAGGVQALQKLFAALPPDLGAAYVVISHLDPDHPSELAPIIARTTSMPASEVVSATPLEANHVYVIAPNRRLVITDHEIATLPFDEPRGRRAPIDQFFRSLAEQHGDGFAVVLSGSGSDGSIGIRAMKDAGGVILVQDPNEASFGSMPRSAIATGCADIVQPIAGLARSLVELVQHRLHLNEQKEPEGAESVVPRILAHLRARTGHDFSHYKRPTILRRLTRRMQLNRLERLEDYLALLRDNAEETQALFGDLLISVTTFFRDAEAFKALADEVIPSLFVRQGDGASLRVWVAGCATGEEVYSIAILLLEEAAKRDTRPEIQIFATDMDAGALATAREGRYPSAIEVDVSEERLHRFFAREGDNYRIRKDVRDLVVFATHSLLKDPPFSRLDLVSCRNLLIYLQREVQKQVLTTLHYALNTGGFLFLGSAETPDAAPGLFGVVDRTARIYEAVERESERTATPTTSLISLFPAPLQTAEPRPPQRASVTGAAHRRALEELAAPSVLVGASGQVINVSETAGRYLLHPEGPLSSDITQLVRPELRLDVSRGVHLAFDSAESSLSLPIAVQFNGSSHRVTVQVRPLKRGGAVAEAVVLFIEGGPIEPAPGLTAPEAAGAPPDSLVHKLQDELHMAREQLRVSRQEYESANEELRAANEELQSINEEYRSTSEELETNKEELQSMNEELQTLNAELKTKVENVSHANADLQNLMAATEGGTLFLDTQLRIKRFTPLVTRHFNIAPGDEGRPITDFTHKLKYDGLVDDAHTVLHDLTPIERRVESSAGNWNLVRIRPYRTEDNRIDGVVVTFIDITQLRRTETALRDREASLRAVVDTAVDAIVTIDEMGTIQSVNPATERMFGYEANELIGQNVKIFMPPEVAGVHDGYLDAYRRGGPARIIGIGREVEGRRKDGSVFPIDLSVAEWRDERRFFTGIMRDITERKRAEQELARALRQEAIGQLAGVIAHDVNNILSAIIGNLELAQENAVNETERAHLASAIAAAQSGAIFSKRLLSLSATPSVSRETFSLNTRVEDMAPVLRQTIGDNIVLDTDLSNEVCPIFADPGEIDSALLNLVLNARDAMPEGGKITISTRKETLDAQAASAHSGAHPGDYARLAVADTGTGMTPDTLRRAGEPLYTTKPPGKGNGLGLSSVLSFIRKTGGFMTLESEQEKGATVSLYLPCAGEELGKAIPSAAEMAIPRGEGELVIAAEDDPQVRETTVKRLEALGYQVIAARTGLEAIDLIKTHPDVKAVLSDVMMPGGATGYAVARWVRDNRPGVGIVLVSGHAPLVDAELVQDVVALTKPFVRVDLARAMRRAIEKSPTQDSPGAASSEGAGPRSAGEDQTVFVVDDDRNVRETIAALLQGVGRPVKAFANAQAFLDSWRPEDSGCLIVDVRMPGMNGLELLARLAERKAHIPAIVITGRGDIAMAVGAMQAGAVDFLEKPINSEKLLAAVDRALKATSNDAANSAERPSAMRIAALTKRERDVLGLVVAGHANKEIAARLGISQRTVESYRAAVMKKMGARSLSELVRMEIAARR